MINKLEIGEVVNIKGREWVLVETKIGGSDKLRPDLILLSSLIKGTNRRIYFKDKINSLNQLEGLETSFNLSRKLIKNNNLVKLSNMGVKKSGAC